MKTDEGMSERDAELYVVTAQSKRAKPKASRAARRGRRWSKVWTAIVVAAPLSMVLMWFAANRVAWIGPWLADGARTFFGTDAVSRIEEWSYGLEDRWNRWWRRGEKPTAHWTTEPSPVVSNVPLGAEVDAGRSDSPIAPFAPTDVGPLFRQVSATGDGIWVPVDDRMHPSEAPVLFKTLIHPDPERPWAELFIVAIDLRQIDVFAAAGTIEPVAATKEGEQYVRSGLVPDTHRGDLVAAFNGGFKAEHGHYGMKVDGVVLLPPRPKACTIVRYADGALRIGTWTALDSDGDTPWWRQTPACMVENGKLHPGLANEESKAWGSALGGETVVRRSAVGLDREHTTLFVGVSNATHARALALGMQHAGASDVAQLDINWSYPHFVTFGPSKDGIPAGASLFDGFAYQDGTYIGRHSPRDFFYLTRRAPNR